MNLLSKLHKNSILTGAVESYCLACGILLRSEEESYTHINNPDHLDKLQTLTHLEKYKDDCILKSEEGYYCSYCNIILPTIKRVSLHVTDPKHTYNKNSQSITKHAGVILAFDAVVIDPGSWHGLDGSTCSVCDQEYADEGLHKQEATHILNLIQAKCQFGENFIYRKVDEDLLYCLTCNDIIPVPEKPIHHECERHLQLYEKSKNQGIAVRNQKLAAIEPNNNKVSSVKDKEVIKPHQVAKDSIENKETREKTSENNTQNGSSIIIDDNRTTAQKNTHCSIKLNTESVQHIAKLNSERGQKQESDPQNKPQEATKIKTQENKLDSENNSTQEPGVNSEKFRVQRLNLTTKTQDNAQLNTAKISQEVKLDKYTQVLKDKSKSLNTNTAADPTEAKTSETVSSKVGTNIFYEFLRASDFILKKKGVVFCTLCDVELQEAEVGIHNTGEHHNIIYAKHIARKNSKHSKKTLNGQDCNKDKESETSWKSNVDIVLNKDFVVPVIEETQKDKPAEVSKEIVDKDSKNTDKNTVARNNTQIKALDFKLNTKNTAPQNNVQSSISMDKTNKETQKRKPAKMDTAQSKRAIKKAQKKAAKAKTAKTKSLPHAGIDSGIPTEVSGPGFDVTTEEHMFHTEAFSATLIDELIQDDADSKKVAHVNGLIEHLKTEKLLELIKSVSQVDSAPYDVVINSKYVLGNLSYLLIVCTGIKAECVACDEKLNIDRRYIQKHIAMDGHRSNVEECLVVTLLDEEFIRQVKTQKYHCGYCNMVLPKWEDMESHLQTYRHSDAKTSASWSLERYQPHLRHCQTREVRSVLSTIFRCTTE